MFADSRRKMNTRKRDTLEIAPSPTHPQHVVVLEQVFDKRPADNELSLDLHANTVKIACFPAASSKEYYLSRGRVSPAAISIA